MPGKAPVTGPAFSKVLAEHRATNPRQATLLEAWREHPDKDKLWQALQIAAEKCGRPSPAGAIFIGFVLGSTMPANHLNDHNEHVLEQFEKLKKKIKATIADAEQPLDLWQDLQRFEMPLRELGQSAYDMTTKAAGRKDQNGSSDRKLFAHRMFRYLHSACGEYLPTTVATMVDIFFPGPEDTERQVRSWLPPKPPKRVV